MSICNLARWLKMTAHLKIETRWINCEESEYDLSLKIKCGIVNQKYFLKIQIEFSPSSKKSWNMCTTKT